MNIGLSNVLNNITKALEESYNKKILNGIIGMIYYVHNINELYE